MLTSGVIFLLIAHGLTLFGPLQEPDGEMTELNFDQLDADEDQLPETEAFEARDGTELSHRYYESDAEQTLILLHGSGYHSRYLEPLATYLSDAGIAEVYTPDLRGHGTNPNDRGDISHLGQIEEDLDDFIEYVEQQTANQQLILGGHSSGGGAVIRYAGGHEEHDSISQYLLIAPYVHHNSQVNNSDGSGWANVSIPRMVGLSMLNQLNLTYLNGQQVISFNMPNAARDGTETLSYSYRLQTSMHPRDDYQSDIEGLNQDTLVIAGSSDESFHAEYYSEVFSNNQNANVEVVDGLTHFGIIHEQQSQEIMAQWINE